MPLTLLSTHELVGIDGFYATKRLLRRTALILSQEVLTKTQGSWISREWSSRLLVLDYLGLGVTGLTKLALDNNGPLMISTGATMNAGSNGFTLDSVPDDIELLYPLGSPQPQVV